MSDSQGIPVRKVYTLMDRCPAGTGKLAEALAKAIPNIAQLVRNRVSHFAKRGPDGKPIPDYADLAQCHKAAAKALAEQQLVVIQTVTNNTDGDLVLLTQLLHSSGQYIDSYMPIKANQTNPQQVASAITYARRTAYCAIIGMAADDDDDGAEATAAGTAESITGSARIELLAMQKIREASSQEERDQLMQKVHAHRSAGTLAENGFERVEAEYQKLSAPRKEKKAKAEAVAN